MAKTKKKETQKAYEAKQKRMLRTIVEGKCPACGGETGTTGTIELDYPVGELMGTMIFRCHVCAKEFEVYLFPESVEEI